MGQGTDRWVCGSVANKVFKNLQVSGVLWGSFFFVI